MVRRLELARIRVLSPISQPSERLFFAVLQYSHLTAFHSSATQARDDERIANVFMLHGWPNASPTDPFTLVSQKGPVEALGQPHPREDQARRDHEPCRREDDR